MTERRAAVVGAGIFGVTAALALRRRGLGVTLFDPGPVPHPLAESTDISKIVRLDYGGDDEYLALMEQAMTGWRAWQSRWPEELFHEIGVAFFSRSPMAEGGFERESMARLEARGHRVQRLDGAGIHARFPAFAEGLHVDGYYNPEGGFAESGRVVAALVREAREIGVEVREGHTFTGLVEEGARVLGITTREGGRFSADEVIMAAGAWTPFALPHLAGCFHAVGQPVFHLRPADPRPFEAPRFPVFGADISRTGYYGFPANRDGIVKIANHGPGRRVHPSDEGPAGRVVSRDEVEALRAFLREAFPSLAEAPLAATRVCVYGDTWDEHLWIARDPEREGLTVAAGGSGHGFKFAPVLGDLIADAALGVSNPFLAKFRWRPEVRPARGQEAARRHEPG